MSVLNSRKVGLVYNTGRVVTSRPNLSELVVRIGQGFAGWHVSRNISSRHRCGRGREFGGRKLSLWTRNSVAG
jgi:hypothetical protein